jgi:hypothetical protein
MASLPITTTSSSSNSRIIRQVQGNKPSNARHPISFKTGIFSYLPQQKNTSQQQAQNPTSDRPSFSYLSPIKGNELGVVHLEKGTITGYSGYYRNPCKESLTQDQIKTPKKYHFAKFFDANQPPFSRRTKNALQERRFHTIFFPSSEDNEEIEIIRQALQINKTIRKSHLFRVESSGEQHSSNYYQIHRAKKNGAKKNSKCHAFPCAGTNCLTIKNFWSIYTKYKESGGNLSFRDCC